MLPTPVETKLYKSRNGLYFEDVESWKKAEAWYDIMEILTPRQAYNMGTYEHAGLFLKTEPERVLGILKEYYV